MGSSAEIQNTKPAMGEAKRTVHMNALGIWSAMGNGLRHFSQLMFVSPIW